MANLKMKTYLKNAVNRAIRAIETGNEAINVLLDYADNERPMGTNMYAMEATFPYLEVALTDSLEAIQDIQIYLETIESTVETPVTVSLFVDQALNRAILSNQKALDTLLTMPDKTGWLREWPNKRKLAKKKIELTLMKTSDTLTEISAYIQPVIEKDDPLNQVTRNLISDLQDHIVNISDKNSINFLKEAIICFENGLYRAAVVLSWSGAIAILQNYIVKNRLTDFNSEANRRNRRWRDAVNSDDLGQMREHEFLDVLESLSVIGKNVKLELKKCLQLRNACGHPNSLSIGSHQVAAHLEMLLLNIFTNKYLMK
ncbi:hypothetical protein QUF64_05135 [Anaerolineales bacterium HSG6]|nr:hypothetical protein [Anaerolineales bacterium HSG6]